MTLTPEERAKRLIARMATMTPTPDARVSVDLIASAIRDAENAALERAAGDCETGVSHGRSRSRSPFWAMHIRSLKSHKE